VVSVFLLLKKGAGDSYERCLIDVQRKAAGMSPLLCLNKGPDKILVLRFHAKTGVYLDLTPFHVKILS
jgi:hypothetical protein